MDSDDPTIKHIFFDPDSLTSKVKENIVIELCSTLELERNKIKFKILPFEMLFKVLFEFLMK